MAEYIEREAAIAWFMPYAHTGESIEADVVISDIKGMKTADVAPVVHGRWVNRFNASVYECSECGTIGLPCWKGCPECLARMDGE